MILAIRMEGQGQTFMTEKQEPQSYQQQPYDSSFKALLDDQPRPIPSFLFGEEIENAQELKESLLKEGTKPSLWVVALGLYEAYEVFNRRLVELYTLLPTMKGGDAELLLRAIEEMQKFYMGQRDRLANHLLWFNTFLGRTTTVTQGDKERIGKKMEDFDSLLDESPFVQKRKAEAEEKGIEKGIEQGRAEGLQKAVVAIVRLRFPDLTEFAQQQVVKINKPDVLDYLIDQVSFAPNEAIVRQLLRPTAA